MRAWLGRYDLGAGKHQDACPIRANLDRLLRNSHRVRLSSVLSEDTNLVMQWSSARGRGSGLRVRIGSSGTMELASRMESLRLTFGVSACTQ